MLDILFWAFGNICWTISATRGISLVAWAKASGAYPVHADPLKSRHNALGIAAQKGVQRPTRRHLIIENGVNGFKQGEIEP